MTPQTPPPSEGRYRKEDILAVIERWKKNHPSYKEDGHEWFINNLIIDLTNFMNGDYPLSPAPQPPVAEGWESKPTEAQTNYWNSMKGKKGVGSPRWKGNKASKTAFHKWISKHHGTPQLCEDPSCEGKSKFFDWAIKTGKKYSHDRSDYLRLCRSCHRRYDLTEDKRKKAIKNLWVFLIQIKKGLMDTPNI